MRTKRSCQSTATGTFGPRPLVDPLRLPHPAFRLPPPPLNCFECPRRAPQSAETQLIAESVARQRAAWPGPTTTAGRGAGPRSAAASRRAPARTSSRRGCRIDHRARGRPSLRRACKADPRAEPLHDPHRRRPELLAPQLWTAS